MSTSEQAIVVVGIDCATDSRRIGLARAEFSPAGLHLTAVECGGSSRSVAEVVKTWVRRAPRALLALDSPLGWPSLLAESLPHHEAGQRLVGDADRLFHRLTDDFVYEKIGGSRPLEVGANLIARTAHASLALLDRIRTATRSEIPLAWEPKLPTGVFAIEVYPAATLRALGFSTASYKKPAGAERRQNLLDQISTFFSGGLDAHRPIALASADALDAIVCTLAGADFLRGEAMPPNVHPDVARREGWIWVRPKRAD